MLFGSSIANVVEVLAVHDLSANFDTSDLLELDGHYYLVVDSAKTYAEATAYAQTLNLDGYSGYLAVISSDAESQFVYDNILVPNQYRSPDSSGYGPADFYYFGLTRIDGEWLFEHPDGLQPVSDALTDPWATTNFISDANRTVAAITGDSYIPGSWEDAYRSRGEWIAFGTTGAFYSIVEFEPNGVDLEPQVISFDLNEPGSYFYSMPLNNGGVIAVWENSPVHDGDIVYQRFNIDGTPSDNKVVVADDLHTHVPAIAELKDGSVVVTYVSYDYSAGRYQAAYKIFDDQDLLVTEGLLSNTLDDYNGIRPVALESGDFVISYRVSDNFPQTSGYAQGFQFFDSAGVPDGNEIIIPQPLGGGREAPVVHGDNTLAFLWASSNDLRLNIYELSTLREGSIDDALIADQVVYSQSDQLGNYELLKSGDGYYVTFGDSGTFYIAEYASDGSLLQAGSPIVEGLSSAAHMQVVDLGLTGQLMVLYSWQPDSTVYETYAKIVSTDGFADLSGPQKVASGQLNTDADLFFESGTVFFSTHDGVTTSTHGILFNVAPEFDQTSYLTSVDENITTGSFTLTTNVLDPENDPLVYSLSGPDNGYFAVDPDRGVISLTVSPDYEFKSSYDLVIEVSDGFSVATAPISVEVIDGNDEPEGSVAIVGDPVVGEYVTLDMLGLTDDDGGIAQVLSYHWYRDGQPLEGGRAATSNPDNKQLPVLEEDIGSSLSVEITYIDGRGFTNTVMSSPTTPVLDLNDPPEFLSPSLTLGIDENVSTSTVILDATATDPDGDSLTYSLQGNDASSFTVDSSSGEVRFNESPDYESHASYDFTVTASDGELSGSVDVTVNVNDVNDAPILGDLADGNVIHGIDTVRSVRVATDTTGALVAPAVDSWPDGHSVVAWSAFQDDNISQVYAQILGPDGQKVGDEILVCADNEGQNGTDLNYLTSVKPSVAVLESGQFVVGWNHGQRQGLNIGEADTETVFRIFNQDGTPVTPIDAPIVGYDPVYNNGHDLDILALSDGGFMIALGIHSRSGDGLSPSDSWEVVAQRFDDNGAAVVGGRIHVNTSTWANQSNPSLTELGDGTIMAVWQGGHQSLGWEIFGQRIDGAGNKLGSEFRVVTSNTGDQLGPASVVLGDGTILVAWRDHYRDYDYYAQRIDQDGAKIGSEFKINQTSSTTGNYIDLVPTPGGFFAVYSTFESTDVSGGTYTTYGRHFQADGTPASDEIEISTYTHSELPDSRQDIEAVEIGGRILVVSETNGQDEADWSDSVITASFVGKDTVSVSVGSVDENVSTSMVIFDADATDADGDELTYSVSGADADKVTVDADNGEVRFNESPDYESGKTSYVFTVTASDGSLTDTIDVTLNVTDVNEPPAYVSSTASASVAEDAAVSTVVYTADASDEDGDTLTFSLGGTDGSLLTIDSTTGEVTLNASPNYENKDQYLFTITASDGSLTDTIDVTLDVTDVNEAPQLERLSTSTEKISILNDSADIQITPYMGYWSSVALADGTFAVAWSTTPPSGGSGGIYFQRVSDTGQPIETPLLIDGSGESGMPEMLALPDGTIVLSYTEYHSGYRDIEIRHIDSLNNVVDPGIANTDSTGDAYRSHLADLGTGAYVASWTYSENHPQILPSGGFAQLIDYDGTFIGDRFAVIPEEPSNHLVDTVVVDGLIVSVYRDASAGLYGWSTVDPMEKSIETSTSFEDANSVTIASVDDGILATWSVGRPDTGDGSTVIYGQKFGVEAGVLVPRGVPVVLLDNAPGVFSVSGISPIISGDSEVGYAISWIQGDDINAGITHAAILDTDLNVQSEREVLSVPTGNSSGTSINADPTTDDDDGVDAIALARDLGGALYLSTLEFGVQYKTILEVAENSHESVVIHGFEASDPESDDLLFSLSGSDADYLWIDPETGDLRLLESADFETKDSYEFSVTASDGALSDSIDVTLEVTDEPETIPLTDRVVISMSGATYPVDTWELTLVEQINSGELQTYVITAGDFSITGSNIQNAANAFVDALNAQLPDGLTVVNLTADSLTAPQLIEISGSNQFAATLRVESGTGAFGSVNHAPVIESDPMTIVSLPSDSPILDIVATFNSFAALHEDGSVSTWGATSYHEDPSNDVLFTDFNGPNDDLSVIEIYASWAAFAGLRSDGSVVTWGHDAWGGELSPIYVDGYIDLDLGLTDVVSLDANYSGFSAIRADGSVVTWGDNFGGPRPYYTSVFEVGLAEGNADNPPVQIVSNDMSQYVALLSDGSVIGWGQEVGLSTLQIDFDGPDNNLSVESILGSGAGFHAIRTDGSVIEWGSSSIDDWRVIPGLDLNGPDDNMDYSYSRSPQGYGVGIREDGSLAVSDEYSGVDWNGPEFDLTVTEVIHNWGDTLILRSDGSVISLLGSLDPESFSGFGEGAEVSSITANGVDFAAILSDGTLIPSLSPNDRLDSDGFFNDLTTGLVVGNVFTFASIRSDGSVLAWVTGEDAITGPDFDGPLDNLDAVDIYTGPADTDNFAVVLSDGSVVSWTTPWTNDPVIVYENQIFQYQVRVTDPDQQAMHLISIQSDTPWLTVDQESMVLSGIPDQADVGLHTIELLVTDNEGLSTTQVFDVLVRDVNQAPEFMDDQIHVSIPEQSDPNLPIYVGDAFDPDGDVLTYQVDGMDAEYLSIDSQSGEVRLLSRASYLVKDQYEFEVIASDGEFKDSTDISISVDPFFDTRAFYAEVVSASKQSIEIDIKLNPTYSADRDLYLESFQFEVSPADEWDTFSNLIDGSEFAFDWGEGYDSLEGLFQSLLYNAQPFDQNVGSVGGYAVFLDQQHPATPGVFISDEFILGRLTLGPAEEGTYLLELNNGSFQLSGIGEVAAPDISVILDVRNNSPVFEFNTVDLSVHENGVDSELIYSASAKDIDLDHLQYFLTGADSALLDIDSETGDVYLVRAADFETKDVYHFSVGVTDGDLHDLIDLTLNVQDSNDATDGVVTFTGSFKVGEILELDWSGLSDQDDGLAQIQSYRWYRDGEPLSLESVTAARAMSTNPASKGILLTHEDIGSTLSVEVTYLDGHGYSNTIMSEESAVISAGDYQPLDTGVYFDGTVLATSDSPNFGSDGEGTTLITLRPDHQASAHSMSLLKVGGFDVNLDFDGSSGYVIRAVTASGDELTTQTLMTGEETTFAIRYLAVEGELELITPNEHVSMIGAGWETPMLDAVIGEGYQGFISQIVNYELRDPEIDLMVLKPGEATEEAPNVRELFRLTDLDAGTRSVQDDETAYGSHLLEFSHDVKSGGYHKPEFTNETTIASVEENHLPDSAIFEVSATDDDGDVVTFALIDSDHDGLFSIDPVTGQLFMHREVDYERQSSYDLTVEAFDSVLAKSMDVTVQVIDVDEYRASGSVTHWKDPNVGIDASIRLVSEVDQEATSALEGSFSLDDLLPANYEIEIEAAPVSGRKYTALDALMAMKIAVGLIEANPYSIIAADVNQNGRVTSADALDILKMAVDHSSAPNEQFVFVDQSFDVNTISKNSINYPDELTINIEADAYDVNLVGVLLGDVDGSYSNLI